jgi:DNA polymerase/3'-5' exonuclease PolX
MTTTKRFNINASAAWCALNRLAVHAGSSIPVDLFATTAERWFVSLVARTGSKEMNTTLAGSALRRGMQLHMYGVLEVRTTGEQITPQSEREVFERLGVTISRTGQR